MKDDGGLLQVSEHMEVLYGRGLASRERRVRVYEEAPGFRLGPRGLESISTWTPQILIPMQNPPISVTKATKSSTIRSNSRESARIRTSLLHRYQATPLSA